MGVGDQHQQAGPGEASTGQGGREGGERASVEFTPQLAYQLHWDVNAAWDLWEVGVAMYAGVARPAYLMPYAHAAQPPGTQR
eukprot:1152827-Pelagomonas_calceolata.AAC.1